MQPTLFAKCWTSLNWLDVALSFTINMIAALSAFLLGVFFRRIPHNWREFRAHQFWGRGDPVICYGSLQIDRNVCSTSPFVKIYRDGTTIRLSGPSENVMGDSEIRSSTHLVSELSRYNKGISIKADNASLAELNGTIIALGSDRSNEMARLVLREPNNGFLEFAQENGLSFIRDKRTGERFVGFQPPVRKDYGIILKIANPRLPGKFFFVCAGLGDWGTSGASFYLAWNWNNLRATFRGQFGAVVEVDIGSDKSARLVSSASVRRALLPSSLARRATALRWAVFRWRFWVSCSIPSSAS